MSAAKKGWKVGDDITNLTRAGNSPAWSTVRQRYWKNFAQSADIDTLYGAFTANRDNIKRMKRGLAPIGWDGASVHLHHWQGIANDFFDFSPVSETLHKMIHSLD